MSYFPFIAFFSLSLFLGSLLSLSSSSWVLIWAGLEINMLSFIPIMMMSSPDLHSESAMKYFLAQALGSGLILMGGFSSFFYVSAIMPMWTHHTFLFMGILIKLGVPPCHFWFPAVMSFISWPMCMLLTTWQKLAPLLLLITSINTTTSTLLIYIILMSSMISALGGITQTQLKPLLAYSSIGHMSWMITASVMSTPIALLYFLTYIIISLPIMAILHINNFTTMKASPMTLSLKPVYATFLFIALISLGGVPPLLGFFPKWMVIQLSLNLSPIITSVLILGATINLFYYLNIVFMTITLTKTPLIPTSYSSSSLIFALLSSTALIMLLSPMMMLQ